MHGCRWCCETTATKRSPLATCSTRGHAAATSAMKTTSAPSPAPSVATGAPSTLGIHFPTHALLTRLLSLAFSVVKCCSSQILSCRCSKQYDHAGRHSTQHGNLENFRFMANTTDFEFGERKCALPPETPFSLLVHYTHHLCVISSGLVRRG